MKSSVLYNFVKLWIFVIIVSFSNVHFLWSQALSFPGAEGSLRYGVENTDGPGTIVFGISGDIQLKSHLTIEKSYMTIAGQTAPAGYDAIETNKVSHSSTKMLSFITIL